MPGHFFMQKFLRDVVEASCTHAVIEMSSEGPNNLDTNLFILMLLFLQTWRQSILNLTVLMKII